MRGAADERLHAHVWNVVEGSFCATSGAHHDGSWNDWPTCSDVKQLAECHPLCLQLCGTCLLLYSLHVIRCCRIAFSGMLCVQLFVTSSMVRHRSGDRQREGEGERERERRKDDIIAGRGEDVREAV